MLDCFSCLLLLLLLMDFYFMCYYGYGVIGWEESVEFLSCAILGLGSGVARTVWCEHGMAWHGYLEWRGAHRLVVLKIVFLEGFASSCIIAMARR